MLYVPVVPPQPPSPRTRELADLLGRVIEEYERHHPNVSGAEVREAVRLAAARSRSAGAGRVAILAGLGATAALGGIFAFVAANQGQVPGDAIPMVAVSVAVVGLLLVVAVLKSRGR